MAAAFAEMYRVSIFPVARSAEGGCPGPGAACDGGACRPSGPGPRGPGAPWSPSTCRRTAIAAALLCATADAVGAVVIAAASITHKKRWNCPARLRDVVIAKPILFGAATKWYSL